MRYSITTNDNNPRPHDSRSTLLSVNRKEAIDIAKGWLNRTIYNSVWVYGWFNASVDENGSPDYRREVKI